jgi:hypothetical protein
MDLFKLDVSTVDYLSRRFAATVAYHIKKGREVTITFEQYIAKLKKEKLLFTINRMRTKWLDNGKKRRFGIPYVLAWRSQQAFRTQVVSEDNMQWSTRKVSKETGRVRLNTKRSEETKRRISQAKKGKPYVGGHAYIGGPERDKKLSIALTGRIQPESQKEARRRTWKLKREAKELTANLRHQEMPTTNGTSICKSWAKSSGLTQQMRSAE